MLEKESCFEQQTGAATLLLVSLRVGCVYSKHMIYADRADAGKRLAEELRAHLTPETIVLGLPRGGVPVAYEIASQLGLAMNVLVSRKVGAPNNPELAVAAVAEGDCVVVDDDLVVLVGMRTDELARALERERAEVARRARVYRREKQLTSIANRLVVLVDDGLATGLTARAACQAAYKMGASQVVLAVPIGSADTVAALESQVDQVVCPQVVTHFRAVGQFYQKFSQVSDQQVIAILEKTKHRYCGD